MTRRGNSVEIEAPAADIWTVVMNVEDWPKWASQFKRLDHVDSGPLRLGSRVRVRPKGLPASVWQVTEYKEGRSFTWQTRLAPGLRLTGGHELTPKGGRTATEFWLEPSGPLGRLLGPILSRTLFRRNTRAATEGLRDYVIAMSTERTDFG
jgi:hypothetical protein